MLCPPNDESSVIDSPLLVVPDIKSLKRSPEGLNEINEVSQHEYELIEKLLKETLSKVMISYTRPKINLPTFPQKKIRKTHGYSLLQVITVHKNEAGKRR
ncbi:hypothetical protein RCL_jg1818.t1 [Rhizophagus clarus]|uniref:Uncharacterized protein n=1 Tax=Rhizophagus clarus TaxID=94130 RepID=A0A8H3QME2_9GLOM|nr:hypothetical protein RCL_jg1818.t1 [Rhizophagus clarus]